MGKNSLLMWNTLQIVQIYGSLNELISPYVCFIRWHSHIQHIYLAGLCPPKYFLSCYCLFYSSFTVFVVRMKHEWFVPLTGEWQQRKLKSKRERQKQRQIYMYVYVYMEKKKTTPPVHADSIWRILHRQTRKLSSLYNKYTISML